MAVTGLYSVCGRTVYRSGKDEEKLFLAASGSGGIEVKLFTKVSFVVVV